jgi:predicted PurR-regulated permease PerM
VKSFINRLVSNPTLLVGKELPHQLLTFGGMALGGLSSLVLMLTLAVYFMIEGKRTTAWLLAFFRPETRFKLHQTMRELSEVISAYVGGQFITSRLAYIVYHAVENYFIVPIVYGNKLRLSTLASSVCGIRRD